MKSFFGKNTFKLFTYLFIGLLLFTSNLVYGQYQSSILYYDDNDRLVYHSDEEGSRIPDFSYAGYKYGEAELPDIPVVLTIDPISGDNTSHIQAAIDQVSAMPLTENGHRGALLLNPGTYTVSQTIYVKSSGVVLRGAGENNTIIYGTGTDRRSVIIIGTNIKNGWGDRVSGSTTNLTSEYVPVGSRTFEIEDASMFSVGDNIVIRHPSTDEWLKAVNYGETHGDVLWQPGEIDMYFNRFITRIEGNKIQVDVPIYHDLDRSLSQAYVWIYTRSSIITECGIENLTIDIETAGEFDNDHPEAGVKFVGVEDSWVNDVTTMHFAEAGIWLNQSSRVTVLNSKAIVPHAEIEGGRRYNFYVGDICNNVLFKGCHGSEGRHTFVSNGAASVAGAVFTQCTSTGDYTSSESHRRWGAAILWDDITFSETNTERILAMYNRGSWGTGHGWTGTYQVAWNISAPENDIVVQQAPIGQNYAIGCDANVTHIGPFNPHPSGWIEGTGEQLLIESLYEAQLSERLNHGVSPDAPGKLEPTGYAYTDTSKYVKLEWFDMALDENQYVLERSADGGNTYTELVILDANVESYTDSNLVQENYYYRLKAVNEIGSSAWSNIAQALGYDPPEMRDITFRINMSGITDFYEGGDVWLTFGNWDTWYVMTDNNGDSIYTVTIPVLEGTELLYFFGYQNGPNPDNDYHEETVSAECSNADGYRSLYVTESNLILPAVLYGGCQEARPTGTDITDLENTVIKGSNDDEPWISATQGHGSPPGEEIDKLIDNDIFTKYLVRDVESWIEISMDTLSLVSGYTITSANDIPARDPRSWEFQGWDSGEESWVALHSVVDNASWDDRHMEKSWTIENDQWFSRYRLNITAINFDSQDLMQMAELQIWGKLGNAAAIETKSSLPAAFNLAQNYPNPFNPATTIRYNLEDFSDVTLTVYNIQGQLIKTLVQSHQPAGSYEIQWNTTTASGARLASGLYFYKLHAQSLGKNFVRTRKMLLMK